MSALRVCTFRGLQNLPLYVAQREGFFGARDVEVAITYTGGSGPQIAGLARGDYDLIQTAPDNVINADANPAGFGLDPASAPRLVMLMGGSTGPLVLCAQPAIATLAELRGAVLGVDNPSSGFALVMYDILARAGLVRERDYAITVAGGTSARLEALWDRAIAATILYAPYDAIAVRRGYRRLAASPQYYAAYASLATAASAAWVDAHSGEVTRYIAAILQALRWIHDPAHADAARDLLQSELGLDAEIAAGALAAFVDPMSGFGVDAPLHDAALEQVIALRAAYAGPTHTPGPPERYCDLRWYRRARGE